MPALKKKPLLVAITVVLTALCGTLLWAYWWNDFDFERPASKLTCNITTTTTSNNQDAFRFIAFGDFGQGTPFQAQLGQQMEKLYIRQPFSAALLLGDNIYPDGNIKRLAHSHFETPYAGLIKNNVEFIAAIGDHDDRKAHLADEMRYFKMPAKYYKVSKGNIDFFVLNTTFFVRSNEQQHWIANALKDSQATWKIVIGHHPLYSSGRNGNTEGLRKILEPLLVKNNVDFYLAGHDHDYERFDAIQGVYHIVSGGGGSFLYPFKSPKPQSQKRLRTHHFLSFEVQGNRLSMSAINRFGDTIDCMTLKK